jgi:hypothetical protein
MVGQLTRVLLLISNLEIHLTHLAELPKGAKINLNDPFTKKKQPILPAIFILSLLAGAAFYFLWKLDIFIFHFKINS